jgi:hypothetical protein
MGDSSNYHGHFLKSPHHLWLGVCTLGAGFISAQWLGLIAGAVAYALGWIYLPDLPFFKRWVDRRKESEIQAQALAQAVQYGQKRQQMIQQLSQAPRNRYQELVEVCRDIEKAGAEAQLTADPSADPRLRKLDELMWTYLRLLAIEDSMTRFLEKEQRENLAELVQTAEQEAFALSNEVDELKKRAGGEFFETKQRLFQSRVERLEVLRKRWERLKQAQANREVVVAEQERLEEQVKLIRAESVAAKNADALSARIDTTVEHLEQTNKWIAELAEFKDVAGDMPSTDFRLGYEVPPTMRSSTAIPPLIASSSKQPPKLPQRNQ